MVNIDWTLSIRNRIGRMGNDDYKDYWYPALLMMTRTLNLYDRNSGNAVSVIADILGWEPPILIGKSSRQPQWAVSSYRLTDREKRILKMMTSEHWPTLYKAMQVREANDDSKNVDKVQTEPVDSHERG